MRVGQAARVRPADARDPSPDASAAEEQGMAGKVAFVGRVADPQTGNLPIRVLVDNPQGRLTIGQSIRVSIIVDERKDVLQVPAAAILDLGEGPVLYVVRDGKSVVLHPEVRTPHEGWIEVSGTDLKEGEPVIVEGGYNLPEKTPVKLADEEDRGGERQGRRRRAQPTVRGEDRAQGGAEAMSLTVEPAAEPHSPGGRDQPRRPGQAVLRADRPDHDAC